MKIDIIEIVKQSINIQILSDDKQILPIHIRKAIEYIYPNISSYLIIKCRSFLSMYKQNNRILDEYD